MKTLLVVDSQILSYANQHFISLPSVRAKLNLMGITSWLSGALGPENFHIELLYRDPDHIGIIRDALSSISKNQSPPADEVSLSIRLSNTGPAGFPDFCKAWLDNYLNTSLYGADVVFLVGNPDMLPLLKIADELGYRTNLLLVGPPEDTKKYKVHPSLLSTAYSVLDMTEYITRASRYSVDPDSVFEVQGPPLYIYQQIRNQSTLGIKDGTILEGHILYHQSSYCYISAGPDCAIFSHKTDFIDDVLPTLQIGTPVKYTLKKLPEGHRYLYKAIQVTLNP